jgi:Tol biopolymer transport system component
MMTSAADLELLEAYLDRRLCDAETAALEARLLAEPVLAEALVALAREETILVEWAKGDRAVAEVAAEPTPAVPSRRRWLFVGSAVAVAAALAALATLLSRPSGDGASAPLAVLDEMQGDVFVVGDGGRVPAHTGQKLFAGHELATSGDESFAAVTFGPDTRLELGADTRVTFQGKADRRVVLEEGVLTGERPGPDGAPPIVLATPHAEAVVRGSHFSFTAAPDSTLVEMEGGVFVRRRSDGKGIDLPGGSLVVAKGQPLKPKPLANRITQFRAIMEDGVGPVHVMVWSRDGKTIATGGQDGLVRLWDIDEREVRLPLPGHTRPVRGLAFSPQGSWIVAVSDDKAAHLRCWDATSGQERLTLKAPKGVFQAVAVSPDGRTIATGGTAGKDVGEIRLWDAATEADRGVLHGHVGEVIALGFAPDGRTLASAGSKDNAVKLWDLAERREVWTFAGHTKRVNAVAFTPDGRTLATASRDGTLRLLDAASGEERRSFTGDGRDVRALAFSADGQTLAAASGDLARLWDVPTGAEGAIFKGHKNQVTAVAFSPNGKTLATAGWEGSVKLWDVPTVAR